MISTGAHYDIDPRLFAAIAVAENGQYQNNPFALGPNGSATFASIAQAIQRLGSVLDTYIYRWRESTVDRLWDGNPWVVDPHKALDHDSVSRVLCRYQPGWVGSLRPNGE